MSHLQSAWIYQIIRVSKYFHVAKTFVVFCLGQCGVYCFVSQSLWGLLHHSDSLFPCSCSHTTCNTWCDTPFGKTCRLDPISSQVPSLSCCGVPMAFSWKFKGTYKSTLLIFLLLMSSFLVLQIEGKYDGIGSCCSKTAGKWKILPV